MSGKYILDAAGEPLPCDDLKTWALWFEHGDRQIGLEERGAVRVSTVFLGLDHSFNHIGPPVLYETMVFGGDMDGEQERYCTKAEAETGHAAMVAKVWPE